MAEQNGGIIRTVSIECGMHDTPFGRIWGVVKTVKKFSADGEFLQGEAHIMASSGIPMNNNEGEKDE